VGGGRRKFGVPISSGSWCFIPLMKAPQSLESGSWVKDAHDDWLQWSMVGGESLS